MSCVLTVSTGIENPTPEEAPDGEYIAVLIPIRFPELSRSGPPLFPGLMAASVCMTSWIGLPVAAELISLRRPLSRASWMFSITVSNRVSMIDRKTKMTGQVGWSEGVREAIQWECWISKKFRNFLETQLLSAGRSIDDHP